MCLAQTGADPAAPTLPTMSPTVRDTATQAMETRT